MRLLRSAGSPCQLEQFCRKGFVVTDDNGFFDGMFQFADIAVPGVERKFLAGAVRQLDGGLSYCLQKRAMKSSARG